MRTRILHVIDTMLGMGGMEKNVVNLIRRLDPARFEHVVCVIRSLGSMAKDVSPDRGTVFCLGKGQAGRSLLAGTLARNIERIKPQIVHSRNWGTIEAVFAGAWAGSCALIHSEHGLDGGGTQPEPLRRRVVRRAAYHLADRVFSVSYHLRAVLVERTGFPTNRIAVLHNGVDTQRFFPDPATRVEARREWGIQPGEFCYGALGRLEPVKDLRTLLRSLAALPGGSPSWRLLVAGDGSEARALREMADSTPELAARVTFLGEIECTARFLNAIDSYVLPSIYEGISNSLLEAMATGLPVVASAVGGNPEVIVDGESGLLFAPGCAPALTQRLHSLLCEGGVRASLGARALERMRLHFSTEAMVRRYDALYRSLAPSVPSVGHLPPI